MSLDRRQTNVPPVPYDQPAPTVTGAPGAWVRRDEEGGGVPDDTPPNLDRRAVMGDARVAPPGYRGGHDERSTTMMANAIRVELAELAVLQDFPAGDEHELADGSRCGWPFQGTRSDQAKIIGNAVPAGLAEAIVRALTRPDERRA